MKEITFNQERFDRQKSYNEKFCENVNKVLIQLTDKFPALTDTQVELFINNPADFTDEIRAGQAVTFYRDVQTLPKSVRQSLRFVFEDGKYIEELHHRLPLKSPLFTDYACKIDGGRCIFDEGLLRQLCTIQGDERLEKIWTLANQTAENLNELETLIRNRRSDWRAIECPQWLELGLLRKGDQGYQPDPERLRQLS